MARLSELQLDLFKSRYPGTHLSMDKERLAFAFLAFANGSLRDAEGSEFGQPNSAHAFSFAEFAWLAIEMAVDVDEWTLLLPALVEMQKLYCDVYRPPEGAPQPYRWLDYGICNFNPTNSAKSDAAALKQRAQQVMNSPQMSSQETADAGRKNAWKTNLGGLVARFPTRFE